MTREEIISGLQFTIDMFLFDPNTGETFTEPRNDMDKTTIDACKGAIELLKQEPTTGHWIEHDWEKMREKGYYRCSVCDYAYQRCIKEIRKSDVPYIDGQEYILWKIDHYCPNCGAKMVESQKSEDNNE